MKNSSNTFYRTVWLYFIIFLLYASLVPFQLKSSLKEVVDHFNAIRWVPYFIDGHRVSLTDLVSNITLFLPLGFFAAGALYSRIKTFYLIVLCAICGFLVSSLMELLQLFTTIRVPSITDICNNTLGAISGCLIYLLYHNKFSDVVKPFLLHQLKRPLYQVYTLFIFVGILFYQLIPFDFSLDIGTIKGGIKFFLKNFHVILQWRYMQSSINNFLFFTVASYALYNSFFRKESIVNRLIWTVGLCSMGILGIEFMQLFIASRGSNISNIVCALIGVANGLYWNTRLRRYKTRLKKLRVFFTVNYTLFFLFNYLFPFTLTDTIRNNISLYSIIPFASYFVTISLGSIVDLCTQIFLFVPLGCYCAKANGSYKKSFWIGCLIALLFESSHIFLATRFYDITDILSGGIGSALGHYCTIRIFLYRRHLMASYDALIRP